MNEYDHADFHGVYEGKSLIDSAKITTVPWDIEAPQAIVCSILDTCRPGRLLDVGCGLAYNAKAAFDRGFEVTAFDSSPAVISTCRSRYADTKIDFLVLDACNTALTTKFDYILDSAVYHTIPSRSRAIYLEEMYRVGSDSAVFHLITFAPSVYGMPKPLSTELSAIASCVEPTGWLIKQVTRVEYSGNAEAIEDFCRKKRLNIRLDSDGMTRLPAWHIILVKMDSL